MSITLNQTRVRPDDTSYEVARIGVNYDANRVIVTVRFGSGEMRDVVFEDDRLVALRNAVNQFAGLRNAIEQYIASHEAGLEGT